ncbi:MAG: DUF2029 domain-containing protein [Gemmataceae bacterium]|nr:DUF2029 domain-containing protein [Gemmataceae bacterium]
MTAALPRFRLPPTRRAVAPHPAQRVALVVWAVLLAGVAGRVLAGPTRSHTVVPIYLAAAEHWLAGDDLYRVAPGMDIFRNPPWFAAAFVPLTAIPEKAAGLLWRGLGAAVFLLGLRAWLRDGLPRPLTPGETGAVFALAAIPAVPSLNNGQTNLLLIGGLLFGAARAARARYWSAGGWLALAAGLKVYPAAVALLIGCARRRALPVFAVGCVGFGVLPFLTQSPGYVVGQYAEFVRSVRADDRANSDPGRAPQDVFFVCRVWGQPPRRDVYLGLKLAAAAGMAGLVLLVARRDPQAAVPLALGLGCGWVTVLGPATEAHTYVVLGPTAAIALVTALRPRSFADCLRLSLAGCGYVLLVFPLVRDGFPGGRPYHQLALQPIGGCLVLSAVIWSGVRNLLHARPRVAT